MGRSVNLRLMVVLFILFAITSCAAQKPIDKASVALDLASRSVIASRDIVLGMKTSTNEGVRKAYPVAAKLWNKSLRLSLLYTHLLQIWRATGSKPVNYDKVVEEFTKTSSDLMKLLQDLGVL